MSYVKVAKFVLLSLLIPLVLTACFSNSSQEKKTLNNAVENQLSRENYNLTGSLTLNKQSGGDTPADSWEWQGHVHDEPQLLYLDVSSNIAEDTNNMQLIFTDQKLYTHLPQLNKEHEFFALVRSAENDSQTGITALWSELGIAAANTNAAFFKKTEHENGTSTIEILIEDEHKAPWYDALIDTLALVPFAQSITEVELSERFSTDHPLKQPGSFSVTIDDESHMTQIELSFISEQFELEMQQSFTASETTDPLSKVQEELPWDTVLEQYNELLAEQQAVAEGIPFDEGIELVETYDYTGDAARQSIFDTIKASLQALIDNDKAAFDETFRSETYAQRHEELWNSERKYRFLQIEDLQFKRTGNDSVRVGVLFEYVDLGDSSVSTSAFTMTLRENAEGTWKIDTIR